MKVLLIISMIWIIFAVVNYEKMSWKKWAERCEINSKHPDWYPSCGINFFKKYPQWFIDNGYERYVKFYH